MNISKGIPDDTPENSVKAILEILKEEAELLGVKCYPKTYCEGAETTTQIDVIDETSNKSFRIKLTYTGPPTDGVGTMSGRWALRLLVNDSSLRESPPFRWGLYPGGTDTIYAPPVHILDGPLLRKFLRRTLELPGTRMSQDINRSREELTSNTKDAND